jgi:hypothetical protein
MLLLNASCLFAVPSLKKANLLRQQVQLKEQQAHLEPAQSLA